MDTLKKDTCKVAGINFFKSISKEKQRVPPKHLNSDILIKFEPRETFLCVGVGVGG